MNKVIFLDYDGVINPIGIYSRDILDDLTHKSYKNLKWIINSTDSNIVISSTWRYDNVLLNLIEKDFNKYHIPKWIDITPKCNFAKKRVDEILLWIDNNNYSGNYAIIDDLDEASNKSTKDNFFKTDSSAGLSDNNLAKLIINHLNK